MDFQLPEYFEDDTTPQTETEKLLERIEEIEAILLDGNTWRFVNGGVGTFGILASMLGVSTLSPLSILLLGSSSACAAIAYGAYVLWEGKELGIKPSVVPLSSGQKEAIKELLPLPQKAHYRLVQWYGKEAVEYLEEQGTLGEVIRHAGNIKPIEGRKDHAELAKKAIADHYLAKMPKPVKSPRKVIQQAVPNPIPSLSFSPPIIDEQIDDSADIWQQPVTASRSPIVESYEDDLVNPVYDDAENSEEWDIPLSRKKQERVVPIKDIALDIANFNKDGESHWCFVSPPRVGKSTLLLSAIAKMQGTIYLVDCKGDDTRLRNSRKLNSQVKYLNVNTGEKIDRLFELLEYLEDELVHRQGGGEKAPITLIVDEMNQLNITFKTHEIRSGKRKLFEMFSAIMIRLLGQGLSSKIKVIFSTHSLRVDDLFGNGTILHQMSVVGLGKTDKLQSLKDVITYKIDDEDKGNIRSEMLSAIAQSPNEVIAILVYGVPKVISLPNVDYSYLETAETKSTKTTRQPPVFEEDTTDEQTMESPEVIDEKQPPFSPNDLLAWLIKKGEGFYTPRKISASLSSKTRKVSVADIEDAANRLYQAGEIDLRNWGMPQGREIVYFKDIQETNYKNNIVAFPMGV